MFDMREAKEVHRSFSDLAAQKSHRKIAMTTVAARGLATIPLQKSQGFSLRRPQTNRQAASDFWGRPQNRKKLAATTAASRRSRSDFEAAATTGH